MWQQFYTVSKVLTNRVLDVSLLSIEQKDVAVHQKEIAKVIPVKVMKLLQKVIEFPSWTNICQGYLRFISSCQNVLGFAPASLAHLCSVCC